MESESICTQYVSCSSSSAVALTDGLLLSSVPVAGVTEQSTFWHRCHRARLMVKG